MRGRGKSHSKRKGTATTLTLRGLTGFPDRLKVKLCFEQELKMAVTAGNTTYGYLYGNDIKQPDATSSHKPYVADKWGAIYQAYLVHGSSITLRPGYDSSTTAGGWLGLIPHPTVTVTGPVAIPPFGENPYCKQLVLNPAAAGQKGHILRHYMTTAKAYGISRLAASSDLADFAGNTSSASGGWTDPLNQWMWTWAVLANSSTATPTFYIIAKVVYYVEFFRRTDLAAAT